LPVYIIKKQNKQFTSFREKLAPCGAKRKLRST